MSSGGNEGVTACGQARLALSQEASGVGSHLPAGVPTHSALPVPPAGAWAGGCVRDVPRLCVPTRRSPRALPSVGIDTSALDEPFRRAEALSVLDTPRTCHKTGHSPRTHAGGSTGSTRMAPPASVPPPPRCHPPPLPLLGAAAARRGRVGRAAHTAGGGGADSWNDHRGTEAPSAGRLTVSSMCKAAPSRPRALAGRGGVVTQFRLLFDQFLPFCQIGVLLLCGWRSFLFFSLKIILNIGMKKKFVWFKEK